MSIAVTTGKRGDGERGDQGPHPNLLILRETVASLQTFQREARVILDDLRIILAQMRALQEINVGLLMANSKAILERSIHEQLKIEEAKKKRSQRFYRGWPGLPADKLEDA